MTNATIIRQNGIRRINGSTGRYSKEAYTKGSLKHTKGLWKTLQTTRKVEG